MGEEVFRFALEHTLELVLLLDQNGIIKYANHSAKEQLEYGDELIGKNIRDMIPAELSGESNGIDKILHLIEAKQERLVGLKGTECPRIFLHT